MLEADGGLAPLKGEAAAARGLFLASQDIVIRVYVLQAVITTGHAYPICGLDEGEAVVDLRAALVDVGVVVNSEEGGQVPLDINLGLQAVEALQIDFEHLDGAGRGLHEVLVLVKDQVCDVLGYGALFHLEGGRELAPTHEGRHVLNREPDWKDVSARVTAEDEALLA